MRELARHRSEYQDILIFESASHGRVLMLDGAVQITEADEFVYQEMLTHVPILEHGSAERVLIIGAGDGGVLRRALEHQAVQRVVMVEIDGAVMRLVREHMPGIAGDAWNDRRAEVVVGDGVAYVRDAAPGSFDVIIVDSTDPVGVGEVLFSEAFFRDCARVLGPGGVVVTQSGVPFMQGDELRRATRRRRAAFPTVTAYCAAVPTYVGGFMALGFASVDAAFRHAPVEVLDARARRAGILGRTRYWSPSVHVGSFAVPPYVGELLSGGGGVDLAG